jgi:hypothetical protein
MLYRSTAHQPLLKFVYLGCPTFDLSENRPLPEAVSDSLRPTPATVPTRSDHVVSHHLDGLLRFRAQVYCNSMPNRVRCVSPPNLLSTKVETSPTDDSRIPTAQRTPLEEFPSPAAVPCHHGRCHSCRLPTHQAFPPLLRYQVSQISTKPSRRHLLEPRAPKNTAPNGQHRTQRESEDLVMPACCCTPGCRSAPNQHRNVDLYRSTSVLYSTDESVLCGLFPVPPQPILPWALFPSKEPLSPIRARHLTATGTHDQAKASRATPHPSSGFTRQPASQPTRIPLESVRIRGFPQPLATR